jgi:hypothetical protein
MNALLLFTFVFWPFIFPAETYSETTCEVTGFYETTYSETGTKVLTATGELASVDVLMKPVKPDEGSYEITITRKAPNLYLVTDCSQPGKIVANKFYIETRNCHEFASYDKATLVVTGNFGAVRGKMIFL